MGAVELDTPIKKLSKEEKAAKKALKAEKLAKKEAKAAKLAAKEEVAAEAEAPTSSVEDEAQGVEVEEAQEEEEEAADGGFKVHKYQPPPEPEDETLQCRDCGGDFIFTVGEQEFFKSKGFDNKKTRCAECTAAKKARFGEESGGGKGKGGKGKGGKGAGKGKGGGGFACYNCGEEGHRSSDCSKPRADGGKGGGGGICYAFQKGECNRGDSCKFKHA
jgi:hypothetical protein